MKQKKIIYSQIALQKRKAIKQKIKEEYGKKRADQFSEHVSKSLSELKIFPERGVPLRKKYGFDCDYYELFIEHNYFFYRITEDAILILEIFHEKEDFLYQMFGIETISQENLNYWDED